MLEVGQNVKWFVHRNWPKIIRINPLSRICAKKSEFGPIWRTPKWSDPWDSKRPVPNDWMFGLCPKIFGLCRNVKVVCAPIGPMYKCYNFGPKIGQCLKEQKVGTNCRIQNGSGIIPRFRLFIVLPMERRERIDDDCPFSRASASSDGRPWHV